MEVSGGVEPDLDNVDFVGRFAHIGVRSARDGVGRRLVTYCDACGVNARSSKGGCTNGRCGPCHTKHCTPEGTTSPGHNIKPGTVRYSSHTGQREPVEHKDGRTGIIWRYYVHDNTLAIRWDSGGITKVKWSDLEG